MREFENSDYFEGSEWPELLKEFKDKGETLAMSAVGGCVAVSVLMYCVSE